jgi:hypothetical protein
MNIRFNGIFYPPAAVKRAIRDYKGLADFAYREKSGYALVWIKNIRDKELKPLFRREFCNYVLSLAGTLK